MTSKERLIDGHVLEGDRSLAVKLEYTINEQERILMRQELEEALKLPLCPSPALVRERVRLRVLPFLGQDSASI
jgi:hypothetical protein